jgi:hypothetical protein
VSRIWRSPRSSGLAPRVRSDSFVGAERALRDSETPEQRAARTEAIASRVPDIRFLRNYGFERSTGQPRACGNRGPRFGGWTALAAPDVVHQIQAVALESGGSSNPRAGYSASETGVQCDLAVNPDNRSAESRPSLVDLRHVSRTCRETEDSPLERRGRLLAARGESRTDC